MGLHDEDSWVFIAKTHEADGLHRHTQPRLRSTRCMYAHGDLLRAEARHGSCTADLAEETAGYVTQELRTCFSWRSRLFSEQAGTTATDRVRMQRYISRRLSFCCSERVCLIYGRDQHVPVSVHRPNCSFITAVLCSSMQARTSVASRVCPPLLVYCGVSVTK